MNGSDIAVTSGNYLRLTNRPISSYHNSFSGYYRIVTYDSKLVTASIYI